MQKMNKYETPELEIIQLLGDEIMVGSAPGISDDPISGDGPDRAPADEFWED